MFAIRRGRAAPLQQLLCLLDPGPRIAATGMLQQHFDVCSCICKLAGFQLQRTPHAAVGGGRCSERLTRGVSVAAFQNGGDV